MRAFLNHFPSGPLKLNSTPLRRIAQAYVIATQTKIDISEVKIPAHLNDAYFRRINPKKAPKKGDANIFAEGTPVLIYMVSNSYAVMGGE